MLVGVRDGDEPPPGRRTRASSASPRSRSGTWKSIHAASAQSNDHSRTAAPGRRRPARRRRARARARPSAGRCRPSTTSQPSSCANPRGQLARPAADLEHVVRARPRRPPGTPSSRGSGPSAFVVERAARLEVRLGRVLPGDRRRVVDPHGSGIGAPGIPRLGALPPSQAFTVAPTSANSPSCTRPGRVLARRVGEQQRVLARVVGRRRRRVAAVVGREDEQIAGPQRVEDVAAAAGRSPAGSGGS